MHLKGIFPFEIPNGFKKGGTQSMQAAVPLAQNAIHGTVHRNGRFVDFENLADIIVTPIRCIVDHGGMNPRGGTWRFQDL